MSEKLCKLPLQKADVERVWNLLSLGSDEVMTGHAALTSAWSA